MPRLALHDPDELDPLRRRYVKILLHAATTGAAPKPSPMDAGLVLCDVLAGREPRGMFRAKRLTSIVDGNGHYRPTYPALLLHAWTTACRLRGQVAEAEARAINDLSNAVFGDVGRKNSGWAHLAHDLWERHPPQALSSERAPDIVTDLWNRVADAGHAWMADHEPYHSSVSRPVHCTAVGQQPNGAYMRFDGGNPESWWYFELVVLHAMATFSATYQKDWIAASVPRAALFHHRETQPDHATSQPWAIHAFLLDPETVPTADLMLLAAGVNRPEGLDAVSRILLADAAVCLMVKKR